LQSVSDSFQIPPEAVSAFPQALCFSLQQEAVASCLHPHLARVHLQEAVASCLHPHLARVHLQEAVASCLHPHLARVHLQEVYAPREIFFFHSRFQILQASFLLRVSGKFFVLWI